jgi:hypothetical protein
MEIKKVSDKNQSTWKSVFRRRNSHLSEDYAVQRFWIRSVKQTCYNITMILNRFFAIIILMDWISSTESTFNIAEHCIIINHYHCADKVLILRKSFTIFSIQESVCSIRGLSTFQCVWESVYLYLRWMLPNWERMVGIYKVFQLVKVHGHITMDCHILSFVSKILEEIELGNS